MRPIFCIGLSLIGMTVILDHSFSIQMPAAGDIVSIHEYFCGQYQEFRFNLSPSELDRARMIRLCTDIADRLYQSATCNVFINVTISVASFELDHNSYLQLVSNLCDCKSLATNFNLPQFCIRKWTVRGDRTEVFVLRPLNNQNPFIKQNTPLIANTFYIQDDEDFQVYNVAMPVNVLYNDV